MTEKQELEFVNLYEKGTFGVNTAPATPIYTYYIWKLGMRRLFK